MEGKILLNTGRTIKSAIIVGMLFVLSACQNGGDLTLEPGSRRPAANKGSPFVRVNNGGKALIWEQGKTPTTGVNGWVTVNSVSAGQITGGTTRIIINKARPQDP